MATLAIRGHATRGKEVIEILKMLYGDVKHPCMGTTSSAFYYVENGDIFMRVLNDNDGFQLFTLEEFLEKFPYKVGDNVMVKERNKIVTITDMDWRNGREVIYETLFKDDCYECFSAEDLQPYKEQESTEEQTYLNPKANKAKEEIEENLKKAKEIIDETIKIDIPKGYEFVGVDNQQVVFEKTKPQYPKTFKECVTFTGRSISSFISGDRGELLRDFQKLLICRDAYWKLAGEQMGLGKPWKPDFKDDRDKYFICYVKDEVWKSNIRDCNKVLVFPTEEMRDAFYENFKELIEQCKELL